MVAHQVYANALIPKGYGHPLWEADPGECAPVELADVGYLSEGAFVKLFNAARDIDDLSNRLGFPRGHIQLPVGEILRRMPLPQEPEYISSEGVVEIGADMNATVGVTVQPACGFSFECSQQKGALLILGDVAYRQDALEKRRFYQHILGYHRSWLAFANEHHGRDLSLTDLILVTGCDRTSEWACAAWSEATRSAKLSFTAGAPGIAEGNISLWARIQRSQSLDKNGGPRLPLRALTHPLSSSSSPVSTDVPTLVPTTNSNKCVFVRGFRVGDRGTWFRLKRKTHVDLGDGFTTVLKTSKTKVSGGLSPQPSPLEQNMSSTTCGQSQSNTCRSNTEISDTEASPLSSDSNSDDDALFSSLDLDEKSTLAEAMIGYIFENSTAELALIHDDDAYDLLRETSNRGVCDYNAYIRQLAPEVYLDANVGMFAGTYNQCSSSSKTSVPHYLTAKLLTGSESQRYLLKIRSVNKLQWKRALFHKSPSLYVEICLDQSVQRTKVIKRNLTPVWNEDLMLSANDATSVLSLNVRHDALIPLRKDSCVGKVDIEIGALLRLCENSLETILGLKTTSGESNDICGTIIVQLDALNSSNVIANTISNKRQDIKLGGANDSAAAADPRRQVLDAAVDEGALNVPLTGKARHISDLDVLRNLTVNDQRNQGASADQRRIPLCVVCQERPQHPKAGGKHTTCGLSCAEKLQSGSCWSDNIDYDLDSIESVESVTPDYYTDDESQSIQPAPDYQPQSPAIQATQPYRPQSEPLPSAAVYQPRTSLCIVCCKRPPYSKDGRIYPTCGLTCAETAVSMCSVCGTRPNYSKGSTQYLTCSLKCAGILKERESSQRGTSPAGNSQTLCIVCKARPGYATCGLKCAERLTNLCDYCHQKPKAQNDPHCGAPCQEMAKSACLVCRSRPKNGRYHFCGRTCHENARKLSPLILEVPKGHTTFEMVETKFQQSWKNGQPCPSVKKVYKVVENSNALIPYDRYRKQYGNECFRFHGTGRSCQLGDEGHTTLCKSSSCAACSILKTSFQVSLANPGGAFGQGVYTSSASNKSASYTTCGLMFLTKVILGKAYNVTGFAQVKSLPIGHQSVVFDRMNGQLNETVVYTNEAIRPVFLIIFG